MTMTILTLRHGSHLYGTDTPQSDTDIKGVYIPEARDIVLGRIQEVKHSSHKVSVAGYTPKTEAGEVEQEFYSLDKYLKLIQTGQMVAFDMLFSPRLSWLDEPDEIWKTLVSNRERLLSKKADAFLGYCRSQANKYGLKGSRVAAAKKICDLLDDLAQDFDPHTKLCDLASSLEAFAAETEHAEIIDITPKGSDNAVRHLSVCGRKAPYTISLREAFHMYRLLYNEYGERARQAKNNENVDWKALSHAVRVGHQSLEFLKHHHMTFPRPEAAHLKAIKLGELGYSQVAEEIESLLVRIEDAAKASTLPAGPDMRWCEDFLVAIYGRRVKDGLSLRELYFGKDREV